MGLEKSTFVPTASNGRLTFRSSGDSLEVQFVDSDNTVRDSATLSEDDLRSLLKDNFPTKRKTREAKTPSNGPARSGKKPGTGAAASA